MRVFYKWRSRVYHFRPDCPSLRHSVKVLEVDEVIAEHRGRYNRRPCLHCRSASGEEEDGD